MDKTILCFWDSNTWWLITGTNPKRLWKNERWPRILESLSWERIIEEGLNSRTLLSEDERPNKEWRNGSKYLIPCLDSHDPIDIVVLMLWTNELKYVYENSPKKIWAMLEEYFVKVILNRKSIITGKAPKLIIVSPPLVDETMPWASQKYSLATEKSKKLSVIYSKIAEKNNCEFIDGSDLDLWHDWVHLSIEWHRKLAKKVYQKLNNMNL